MAMDRQGVIQKLNALNEQIDQGLQHIADDKKGAVLDALINKGLLHEFLQFEELALRENIEFTPLLHRVVRWCSVDVVRRVLEAGGPPDILDAKDRTALHVAAEVGNAEVLRCVLDYLLIPTVLDKDQKSPLDVASTEECKAVLRAAEVEHQPVIALNEKIVAWLERDPAFMARGSDEQKVAQKKHCRVSLVPNIWPIQLRNLKEELGQDQAWLEKHLRKFFELFLECKDRSSPFLIPTSDLLIDAISIPLPLEQITQLIELGASITQPSSVEYFSVPPLLYSIRLKQQRKQEYGEDKKYGEYEAVSTAIMEKFTQSLTLFVHDACSGFILPSGVGVNIGNVYAVFMRVFKHLSTFKGEEWAAQKMLSALWRHPDILESLIYTDHNPTVSFPGGGIGFFAVKYGFFDEALLRRCAPNRINETGVSFAQYRAMFSSSAADEKHSDHTAREEKHGAYSVLRYSKRWNETFINELHRIKPLQDRALLAKFCGVNEKLKSAVQMQVRLEKAFHQKVKEIISTTSFPIPSASPHVPYCQAQFGISDNPSSNIFTLVWRFINLPKAGALIVVENYRRVAVPLVVEALLEAENRPLLDIYIQTERRLREDKTTDEVGGEERLFVLAAKYCNAQQVKKLLDAKVDPALPDGRDVTAIMVAGSPEVSALLAERGCVPPLPQPGTSASAARRRKATAKKNAAKAAAAQSANGSIPAAAAASDIPVATSSKSKKKKGKAANAADAKNGDASSAVVDVKEMSLTEQMESLKTKLKMRVQTSDTKVQKQLSGEIKDLQETITTAFRRDVLDTQREKDGVEELAFEILTFSLAQVKQHSANEVQDLCEAVLVHYVKKHVELASMEIKDMALMEHAVADLKRVEARGRELEECIPKQNFSKEISAALKKTISDSCDPLHEKRNLLEQQIGQAKEAAEQARVKKAEEQRAAQELARQRAEAQKAKIEAERAAEEARRKQAEALAKQKAEAALKEAEAQAKAAAEEEARRKQAEELARQEAEAAKAKAAAEEAERVKRAEEQRAAEEAAAKERALQEAELARQAEVAEAAEEKAANEQARVRDFFARAAQEKQRVAMVQQRYSAALGEHRDITMRIEAVRRDIYFLMQQRDARIFDIACYEKLDALAKSVEQKSENADQTALRCALKSFDQAIREEKSEAKKAEFQNARYQKLRDFAVNHDSELPELAARISHAEEMLGTLEQSRGSLEQELSALQGALPPPPPFMPPSMLMQGAMHPYARPPYAPPYVPPGAASMHFAPPPVPMGYAPPPLAYAAMPPPSAAYSQQFQGQGLGPAANTGAARWPY